MKVTKKQKRISNSIDLILNISSERQFLRLNQLLKNNIRVVALMVENKMISHSDGFDLCYDLEDIYNELNK